MNNEHLPSYRVEMLPRSVRRWLTDNDKCLDAVALIWPGGVMSLVVFEKRTGLTPELVRVHYERAVNPAMAAHLLTQPMEGTA